MKFKAFCIIPRKDEIEIKQLVLCKECKHFAMGEGYCKLHGWCTRGDWFCGDGEKVELKTRLYYTQDGAITWEGEDDDG